MSENPSDLPGQEGPPVREPMPAPRHAEGGYQSLFWPTLLIGVGVVWLLVNVNIIPARNLVVLLNLWPVLLIGIGLDILFARTSRLLGALLGLLVIGAAVALVLLLPLTGWRLPGLSPATDADVQNQVVEEALAGAESAQVTLDLTRFRTGISALEGDSDLLLKGDIDYLGSLEVWPGGSTTRRTLVISERYGRSGFGSGLSLLNSGQYSWDVALTPLVPLELIVAAGSGSLEMNLSDLQVSRLELGSGSGSAHVTLASGGPCVFNYEQGSGSASVVLPSGAEVTYNLDSGSGSHTLIVEDGVVLDAALDTGSGSVSIDLPDDAAVRFEVRDSGSGSVNTPDWLRQVEQGDDRGEGVWESAGYGGSGPQITIIVTDRGSGSINVR